MANRLAHETSPYLLQHQHNPVDWYPWGPEALQAACSQNKPIFLSVGYSTCYWCHVMERQCFEVEPIAAVMNQLFINIKVDREERPDVDQLYMTAVQLLTRQGGWPMSVFLLPDLRPFYGGTYFPPDDAHGRPGFPRLLQALHEAFLNRRNDVEKTAAELTQAIIDIADRPEQLDAKKPAIIDRGLVNRLIDYAASDYDPQFGGFGSAPKFPRETLLQLLLAHHERTRDIRLAKKIRHTLDAMANGGIRDQLGGGFHRYSTDAHWLVPHFEIMLYDNAMLAWIYANAFRQFSDQRYARIARGICDFVLREMTDPVGPFYTAFDAEVEGCEGQNYLWTESEIITALGSEDARQFISSYGIDQGPNFADPHNGNGIAESNILYLPAGGSGNLPAEIDPRMIAARAKLLAIRKERKQPLLDTKVLTSWNGLMIRGLAHAGEVLSEPRYTAAANLAADWLLSHHVGSDGALLRTSRGGGPAKLDASLDDYAFFIHALLSLKRPDDASRLMTIVRERFFDERTGNYFFTDNQSSELFARQKVITDSPLPSGNGIIAQVLIESGEMKQAARLLASVAGAMQRDSGSMSALLQAADDYVEAAGPLTIGNDKPISQLKDVLAKPIEMHAAWQSDRTAEVTVQIARGYHINGHDASTELVKTELIATPPAQIDYPASTDVSDGLRGYAGAIKLLVTWEQPPAEIVRLLLRYQPCTDRACLSAASKIIELSPSLRQR